MRKLGELLFREQVITAQQLVEARRYERANAVSLSRALITLGYLTEAEIAKTLARVYELPTVILDKYEATAEAIGLVPAEFARKHGICPMHVIGRALLVAVSDPTNSAFMEELHALTDHSIGMVVSSEAQIEKALDQYYGPAPSSNSSPLEEAVGRNPSDPEPWTKLGCHYGEAGEYELARIVFGQAARFGPNEGQAHWGRAQSLIDLGRHAEAVAPARKAVSLCPSNRQARICLGRALAATGRLHQAIEQFEEASRLSPEWPAPLAELGFMHGQLGNHGAAAEYLEAALRFDPDQPKLWTTLGFALCMSGAWRGAEYALETAVFARPTDAWSRALLGKAQRKLDRTRDAHDSLAEAVRLGFDEPWAWFELGGAAIALGDQSSLERAHERLLKLDAPLARKLGKHLVRKPTSQLRLWLSNRNGAAQEAK